MKRGEYMGKNIKSKWFFVVHRKGKRVFEREIKEDDKTRMECRDEKGNILTHTSWQT